MTRVAHSRPGAVKLGVLVLLLACGVASTARADVYALVVGIDRYTHLNPLRGAVNDAQDIAGALRATGAEEVHLLIDEAATRQAILGTLQTLIEKAQPGDHVFFTYAGHGGQEPEAKPGSEEDGKDETFMLAHFAPEGDNAAHRIRDDDIAAILERARDVSVIFVADSCHSGTMTRSMDPRSNPPVFRFAEYGPIEDDPLPPPPPVSAEPGSEENLLFFAAVREFELAPEVRIDGQYRGALSWAFARGIRGAADRDGDGAVDKGELERFVRSEVKQQLQGRQHPQVQPAGVTRSVIMPARPFPVQLLGADPAEVAEIRGRLPDYVEIVEDVAEARLVWDLNTDEVILGQLGDLAGRVGEEVAVRGIAPRTDDFAAMVARWRLIERLGSLQSGRAVQVDIRPDDKAYAAGDRLTVAVSGLEQDFLTLFNVTSRGTLNFLYPREDFGDPLMVDRSQSVDLTLEVQPPYGAEHFVAVSTGVPLIDLHARLMELDGQVLPEDFFAALKTPLESRRYQLGLHGAYSRPAVE